MRYKILHELPQIPQELIEKTLEYNGDSNNDPLISHANYTYLAKKYEKDGKIKENKPFYKSSLHPELLEWIKTNIDNHFTGIALQKSIKVQSDSLGPHTDRTRHYTLMYLLEHGGENHRTAFYEANDKNLKLERNMLFDYKDVTEVDSVQFPLYTWCLLNAQEIHSVENIPDMRVGIYAGYEENYWE